MEEILIIDDSEQICNLLADYVLPELGYRPIVAYTGRQGLNRLRQKLPDLVLLDLQLPDISGLDLLRLISQEGYDIPVILMTAHGSENIAVEAFRIGARNYLIKPFSDVEARTVIDQALREQRLRRDKERLTSTLQQRVQELTILYRIGKSVSTLMNLEELLERIVEAGVYITRAEEGFLLLRDMESDELYLRAAKNLGAHRARHLRMPIEDTLAGQVIRSGKPIRLDKGRSGAELKVKTGFLVQSLLQVPLIVGKQVIGVLTVDNQQSHRVFTENDQYMLSTLADYAAIAIENTRLYQQVKSSEERYKDLFANAYDLIFMLDQELRITSINRVGPQVMGYDLDKLIGHPLEHFSQPASWEQVQPLIADLQAGANVAPFELELVRNDGEPVYLEISARLMQNGQGSCGIHCIARNLTERRKLEQQLIQSEKLSAIGQLVAGVAHELNNPLTSISGYAQLLQRDKSLSDVTVQDVLQIHTQAERAARIVRNLLIFAREHKPERTTVDLNEVVRSTLMLQSYQLRVDNIQVVTEFEENLPTTIADPHQLQQVFLNLINNAHQAMQQRGGGGTLTLSTRSGHSRRRANEAANVAPIIEVAIGDTGIGISDRDISRIFDPFFTTKPVGQGTGLGLSICFGIIQEHEGLIWADSTPGVGTTIYVELPLRSQTELSLNTTLPPAVAAEDYVPLQVLVVDDEASVGKFLARLLEEMGHRPVVVESARQALEKLDQQQFDTILADVKMPEMDGFDLYAAVSERNPDLAGRIVFITGDTLSPSTVERIAEHNNPFIGKPFAIPQLEQTLRGLMRRRSVSLEN